MSAASQKVQAPSGDVAKSAEPSMEEILASIRRIISDDPNAGRPATIEEDVRVAPPPDDDVLDLAEVAQEAKGAQEPPAPDDVAFRDVGDSAHEPVSEPVSEPISEPVMAQSAQQTEPNFEAAPAEEPPPPVARREGRRSEGAARAAEAALEAAKAKKG